MADMGVDSRLADAAVHYAAMGWSVVPVHDVAGGVCSCGDEDCPAPAKHPRIRWEPAMAAAAPPDGVAEWWMRWPHANIGIVTGLVSGVVVLDIDPRNGGDGTLQDLTADWGSLPKTVESRTGGSGTHLWFAAPDEALPSADLGPGLELKAERSLIVAPPSLHRSGERYAWVVWPDVVDPAPVPSWIVDLVAGNLHSARHTAPPRRTTLEQAEFRAAWERAGVSLVPGDEYYLCPFHDDHHPSLHVDAEGCRWYCFACKEGGGIGKLRHRLGDHRPVVARDRLRTRLGRKPLTISGEHALAVVGESFHQDALLEVTGGRRHYGGVEVETGVDLEDHDGTMVVLIDGLTVGYLAGEDANALRPAVEESLSAHGVATCRGVVRGGWDRGGGDVGLFGVTLFVPEALFDYD